MADKDFVVKNGIVVNTGFAANGTQFTLGTYGSATGGFLGNSSVIVVGNSTVNSSIGGSVLFFGNTSANSVTNSTAMQVSNSTNTATLTATGLTTGNTVLNTDGLYIGNSSVNVSVNTVSVALNSTVGGIPVGGVVVNTNQISFGNSAANVVLTKAGSTFATNADNITVLLRSNTAVTTGIGPYVTLNRNSVGAAQAAEQGGIYWRSENSTVTYTGTKITATGGLYQDLKLFAQTSIRMTVNAGSREMFTITNTYNVGINNPTPTNTLSVGGSTYISDYLAVGSTTSTYDTITGQTNSGNGVQGVSNTGTGVFGYSNSYNGIVGQSNTATGVYGSSNTGWGAAGYSNSSWGVYGLSNTSTGVNGKSISGLGVGGVSNSYYAIYGASNTGGGLFIQSNTGIVAQFSNATNEFVRIASSGYVGIGTNNPDAHLVVNGFIKATTSSDYTNIQIYNTSTGGRSYLLESGGAGGAFSGGKFGIYDATATAARLTIDSAGNMGLGTTTPLTATNYKFMTVQAGSAGGGYSIYNSSGVDQGRMQIDSGAFTIYNFSALPTRFANSTVEQMRINLNGNVGIACTAPSYTLDVSNYTRVGKLLAGAITATTDTAGIRTNGDIYMDALASTLAYNLYYDGADWRYRNTGPAFAWRTDGATPVMQLFAAASGTGGTVATVSAPVTFAANGNMGLGVSTPNVKLDVRGSTYIGDSTTRLAIYSDNSSAGISIEAANYANDTKKNLYLAAYGGNVGVGITSPGAKLHVNTDIRIEGTLPALNWVESDQGTNSKIWDQYVNSGYQYLRIVNDNYSDSNTWLQVGRAGMAVSNISFSTSANVSFGTTGGGDYSKFTVWGGKSGTGTASAAFVTPGAAISERADLAFYSTFGSGTDLGPRRSADIISGYDNAQWGSEYLSFNVGNNGTANDTKVVTSEKMRISSNGNIGIGVQSTAYRLDVRGVSGSNAIYGKTLSTGTGVHGESVSGTGIYGYSISGTGLGAYSYDGVGLEVRSNTYNIAAFSNSTNYGLITINNLGRVGIANSNPVVKLHISGVDDNNSEVFINSGTKGLRMCVNSIAAAIDAVDGSTGITSYQNLNIGGSVINLCYGSGSAPGTNFVIKAGTNNDGFFAGTAQIIDQLLISSTVNISGNQINAGYGQNTDNQELAFNYTGYSAGTTKYRDTNIYNGKNASIAKFIGGASNSLEVYGAISGYAGSFNGDGKFYSGVDDYTQFHGGSIEICSSTSQSFIDFKNSNADDYDGRILCNGSNYFEIYTNKAKLLDFRSTEITFPIAYNGGERQIKWEFAGGAGYAARDVYLWGKTVDRSFGLWDTGLGSGGAARWVTDTSGNFTAAGNVTAYSDIKLKTDITTIDNALDKVSKMRGVMFTRKDTGTRGTGVIAQEMREILPEVVVEGENLSVAYGNIVGVLIEAIKELKAEIKQLKGK